jgi:hypothetical protein
MTMSRSTSPAAVVTWIDWMRSGQWEESADTAIPMLPAMASHVVDLALDPDVSATRITNVVSKDPVLATRVIQLANSAFSAPATSSPPRASARCQLTRRSTAGTGATTSITVSAPLTWHGWWPTAPMSPPTRRSSTGCCTTSGSSSS